MRYRNYLLAGLMRSGKSCRLRWKNYLRPNIKRGGMSQEEEDMIIRMHKLLGNRSVARGFLVLSSLKTCLLINAD